MSTNEKGAASGVSRRAVVKGFAWSTPVIATSIAVPAAAASPNHGGNTCPPCRYHYDPANYAKHDSVGPMYNNVKITVVTGKTVTVTFRNDYPQSVSLNVNQVIVMTWPNGVKCGQSFTYDLSAAGICDPTYIKVDGNKTQYFGAGLFRAEKTRTKH